MNGEEALLGLLKASICPAHCGIERGSKSKIFSRRITSKSSSREITLLVKR